MLAGCVNDLAAIVDGCKLLEEHGEYGARIELTEKRLDVAFQIIESLRDRAPKWVTILLMITTGAVGTFFGLWIQSTKDMEEIKAVQYEIKGTVSNLSMIVAQHTSGSNK